MRKDKVKAKIEDTDYMSQHPEIALIIKDLYAKVLQAKPSADEIFGFVASYFKKLNEQRCDACE